MPKTPLFFISTNCIFDFQVYHYVKYVYTKSFQNQKQNGGFPNFFSHLQTPLQKKQKQKQKNLT